MSSQASFVVLGVTVHVMAVIIVLAMAGYWNGKRSHEPRPSVALCLIRLRLYAPISLSVSF